MQTNGPAGSTSPDVLRRACGDCGYPFHPIHVDAAAPSLDLPAIDGPVVVHGRTTLILRAYEDARWRRGVFFEPSRFRHSAYVAAWGEAMLNAEARITTWEQFLATARAEEVAFVKPNDDLKAFSGRVRRGREWAELNRLRPLDPTTDVVVARARDIDAEWRLFVVAGEVVAGGMYRPSADAHLAADLMRFAERAIARWTPADVFVLDIARVDGGFAIVECNCFNASRFYAADVMRLVRAVSDHQERVA